MKIDFLAAAAFVLLVGVATSQAKEEPVSGVKETKPEPYVYDHRGKRDPFIPLVGATSAKAGSIEDIMSIEDVRLQGIASDSAGKKAVILNGEMLKEGEGGGCLTVKKIFDNSVILVIGAEEHALSIYKEDDNKKVKGVEG